MLYLTVLGHTDAVRAKNMRLVHSLLLKTERLNIIQHVLFKMSYVTNKRLMYERSPTSEIGVSVAILRRTCSTLVSADKMESIGEKK